jgi:hypothetical protein
MSPDSDAAPPTRQHALTPSCGGARWSDGLREQGRGNRRIGSSSGRPEVSRTATPSSRTARSIPRYLPPLTRRPVPRRLASFMPEKSERRTWREPCLPAGQSLAEIYPGRHRRRESRRWVRCSRWRACLFPAGWQGGGTIVISRLRASVAASERRAGRRGYGASRNRRSRHGGRRDARRTRASRRVPDDVLGRIAT